MKYQFELYQQRKIEFQKLILIDYWNVKVYTITKNKTFESEEILKTALRELPKLVEEAKNSSIITHQQAFLIIHEGREGVLILLNWWTDGEMLETTIHFVDYKNPTKMLASIYNEKALVCVWELELFAHERKSWIENILMNPKSPKFDNYRKDIYIQKG